MTAEQVLQDHGIVRPAEVVELAAGADLELAAAATLLVLESGGGANVWGHDGVGTGGIYVKGAQVTKDVYLRYKARRHELGLQGVGPTQLTSAGFQDRADDEGGCWDWRINCSVGFAILGSHIEVAGEMRDGFRRFNGSGDAAQNYADKAMKLVKQWRERLDGTSSESTVEDDTMISVPAGDNDHIDLIVRGRSKLYLACSYNQTVDVHRIDFWGDTPAAGADGQGVGGGHGGFRLDSNRPGPIPIPPRASMVTIRYTAKHSFGAGAV